MSWNPTQNPECPEAVSLDAIETLIIPRTRDLGGFEVRRALPAPKRQMVGPFIFFDQVGPAEFLTGGGIDVRPHPHIGLATVTYLYEGAFHHRDRCADQMVYPGEVNWMIAGNGVTHSERTSEEMRSRPRTAFGIQTWVALPDHAEDTAASFEHHGREALPFIEDEGKQVRLIIGSAWGARAPVKTFTETFYADVILSAGAKLPLRR
jgi:redox-sensitive bicupin YhaK (pirin superfamily)